LRIVTHNGNFHVDDVFAAALLLSLEPSGRVVRSREQEVIDSGDLVFDVGGEYDPARLRFDHHQGLAEVRANGIKYSALGLLWKDDRFGLKFCDGDRDLWQRLDEKLIQYVDADDNAQSTFEVTEYGVRPYTLADLVKLTNPSPIDPAEEDSFDQRFMEAVDFARMLLQRLKKMELDKIRSNRLFMQQYSQSPDERYVILDRFLPFRDLGESCPKLLYVVYPHPVTSTWRIQAVSVEPGSFLSRQPLPAAWRAKDQSDLARVTGVDDATFCHASGFMAGAQSQAGVKRLLELALEDRHE
jgi:uncharacterized UPF0160 family protein